MSTSFNPCMWTFASAHNLIQTIQPVLMEHGWFVALAGGVLNHGQSEHDLDLVAVPMKAQLANLEDLQLALLKCGFALTHCVTQMREHWEAKGSPDTKYVEVYSIQGKRVDIIVAYPEGR